MFQRSLLSFSTTWIDRQITDPFATRARKEGYISRAAYKLLAINDKYRIFNGNTRVVVDLGAAPGSWSQVVRKVCSAKSDLLLIAVDRSPMATSVVGGRFLQGDFSSDGTTKRLSDLLSSQRVTGHVDVILSDMAPNRTGTNLQDYTSLAELNSRVCSFASTELRIGGALVMKCFGATDHYPEVMLSCRRHFTKVSVFKPQAARRDEQFIVALGRLSAEKVKHDGNQVAPDGKVVRYGLDQWPGLTRNRRP